MDQYIYNPPPPPPPPRASGGSEKRGGSGIVAGKRAAPYVKPGPSSRVNKDGDNDDSYVDEENSFIPTIKVDSSDVEKWIAERRKNWPSAKRVAEKEQEKERLRLLREQHQEQQQATTGTSIDQSRNQPPTCKYFLKGKCHNGAKCRFSHNRHNQQQPHGHRQQSDKEKYKRFAPPKDMPLFKRLVQTDVLDENAKVIEFIQYLHKSGRL